MIHYAYNSQRIWNIYNWQSGIYMLILNSFSWFYFYTWYYLVYHQINDAHKAVQI